MQHECSVVLHLLYFCTNQLSRLQKFTHFLFVFNVFSTEISTGKENGSERKIGVKAGRNVALESWKIGISQIFYWKTLFFLWIFDLFFDFEIIFFILKFFWKRHYSKKIFFLKKSEFSFFFFWDFRVSKCFTDFCWEIKKIIGKLILILKFKKKPKFGKKVSKIFFLILKSFGIFRKNQNSKQKLEWQIQKKSHNSKKSVFFRFFLQILEISKFFKIFKELFLLENCIFMATLQKKSRIKFNFLCFVLNFQRSSFIFSSF